jgi:threonine synthase
MAGVQTIAYEIAGELPQGVEHVFSPAGGGGLTLALTKGFQTWKEHSPDSETPKVHCIQPTGNNTISGPLRMGLPHARAVAQSTTSVSGLQVPNVMDGDEVISTCRACGGTGYTVTDELIYESQKNLATKEGIFCEPAGAVGFAGLVEAVRMKEVNKKDPIVCLVTGHGFKDPAAAGKIAENSGARYFKSTGETFEYIESQIENSNKIRFT